MEHCKEKIFRSSQAKIAIIIFVIVVFVLARKIFVFSSAPTKEKDCNFIFPSVPDETKPTTIDADFSTSTIHIIQKAGFINDASCLNKTFVYSIVDISNQEDIKNALQFARDNNIKVTPAGERHSMGGQSFSQNGLVLDMRNFNKMKLDTENKVLNVESGANWEQVQQLLDKEGFAVKAMQSINIFTVGGSLSVNAHGIAHDPGPIGETVESFRIMLANGEIKTASRTENVELFRSAIGGYGLFGIILDVNLRVVKNEMYEWNTNYIDYKEFPAFYKENIEGRPEIGLTYARLSVSPHGYLKETAVHTYRKIDFKDEIPALKKEEHSWINRLVINFSKTGGFGRWVRWNLEKYVEPRVHICSRNQAMGAKEVCLVSRNQSMHDSMGYLKNRLKDTDILQEYFIPQEKMSEFTDGLRDIVQKNDANLLNVTIRIVHKDEISALPYAKEDMFGFVLYFNQKLNNEESEIVKQTNLELIDLATKLNGTFYLPYQLYYSKEQLHKAYPEVDTFFAAKKKYDPTELLVNSWYERYGGVN